MAYYARHSVIYTPTGQPDVVLCEYGDIMIDLPTFEPSVTIQRDARYRAKWLYQAARGNASIILYFTVAMAFDTRAEAEAYGEDMRDYLILHPLGLITVKSCYTDKVPGRIKTYVGSVNRVNVKPITGDYYFSDLAAWLAVEYEFTLTQHG